MSSRTQFGPGKNSNTGRIIHYKALYNARHPDQISNCVCVQDKYDKYIVGSDSASTRVPYGRRISQIINAKKGGKTQYGNFYLGQPLDINYLGRGQGMPGGSGMPPINRF